MSAPPSSTTADLLSPPAPHPGEAPGAEIEEPGPWREAFVRQFRDPANRETLRRFGSLLQSMEPDETPAGEDAGSDWLRRDLGSVAADLAAACSIVREIADFEDEEVEQLEEADRHLPSRARSWAAALDRLVRELEAAIDAAPRKSPAP